MKADSWFPFHIALRGEELERAAEQFQSELDDTKAHEQWKRIEGSVFGAQFDD
jgi:hypothetical protein